MTDLPNFLPGRLELTRGCGADYAALARFHYLADRPATFDQVWTVRYHAPGARLADENHRRCRQRRHTAVLGRIVAVGVLSYPSPHSFARRERLGISGSSRDELSFANRHVRTISRIVVHPQFRALGLSTLLVRQLCARCTTRYVESHAAMARAHPLFARAGMRRCPTASTAPIYYIFDRRSIRRARSARPRTAQRSH